MKIKGKADLKMLGKIDSKKKTEFCVSLYFFAAKKTWKKRRREKKVEKLSDLWR
jgi:hypothetical protein